MTVRPLSWLPLWPGRNRLVAPNSFSFCCSHLNCQQILFHMLIMSHIGPHIPAPMAVSLESPNIPGLDHRSNLLANLRLPRLPPPLHCPGSSWKHGRRVTHVSPLPHLPMSSHCSRMTSKLPPQSARPLCSGPISPSSSLNSPRAFARSCFEARWLRTQALEDSLD